MDTGGTQLSIEVSGDRPEHVKSDLVAVPVFEKDDLSDTEGLDAATGGEIGRARSSGEFSGKLFDLCWCSVRAAAGPLRVVLVGAGAKSSFSTDRLRKAAATVSLAARQRRVLSLAFLVRGGLEPVAAIQATVEGLTLGEFSPAQHKTQDQPGPAPSLKVLCPAPPADADLQQASHRGRVLGVCCNLARGMANEPSNLLTPRVFAERASALAADAGLSVEVLKGGTLADLQMGLILGVARGSAEPPRVVVIRHDPPGVPGRPLLGLVGKGITFDTGGISLKPADGMERMKDDMAGGAAVVCAMRAIALLGAPIRVVGIVPISENMPGGRAIKPGDVLRSASGRSVEVVNTDAEGRLVLADALWYAQQLGATHLVDVATLTGACTTALGRITSGLFGTPDAWRDHVLGVAERAGDRCWPLPLFDDYLENLRSEVADLVNSGGRGGGAITAAMFLKEFTGGLPWAHMDIAGTAWLDEAKPYQPKGASGAGVRTLAELAFTSDRWPI